MPETLKLESTGAKIAGMAGKFLPPIAGILSFLADPLAGGRSENLELVANYMWIRLKNWRFPNLWRLVKDINRHPSYNWIGSALATSIGIPIGQKFLADTGVTLPTTINVTANVIKKTAASATAGGLIGALMWLPGSYVAGGGGSSNPSPPANLANLGYAY